MPLTCTRCKQQFREGQTITARILSVYHELTGVDMDQFQYAVERPHMCMDIQHLVCHEE